MKCRLLNSVFDVQISSLSFFSIWKSILYRLSLQSAVMTWFFFAEETPLMDLLQFMYSGRVQANTPSTVLDVLMAADKYEVATCMRHCSRLLRNLPMTSESALLYLDLPSSILLAEAVQPLTDAARTYLATRYKDITRWGFILMPIVCSSCF